MKTLHAKSPCCRGGVIRFGQRRRQCVVCQSTWRIRKKKRGRKIKRAPPKLVDRYLAGTIPSLYLLARIRKNQSENQLQRRMRYGLIQLLKKYPWPELPYGESLIAIADAMLIKVNKEIFTFYFIFLRPIDSNRAIIIKPYVKSGGETGLGWQAAFGQLPERVLALICALVADGHGGLLAVAKRRKWIIQRCIFHIIAKIQGRRSRWSKSRHQLEGIKLNKLVNIILMSQSKKRVAFAINQIKIIMSLTGSRQLKKYLSGFIRYYQEYRSYLKYPHLNLPRTSNAAEVIIGEIRSLCRRAHGFRTLYSLKLWVFALLKRKKFATCNGFHQPN